MNKEDAFAGINVSKSCLDLGLNPTGQFERFSNDESGIANLVALLEQLGPALIVVEATGGLEKLLVAALRVTGLPIAVVNVRRYATLPK